MNASAPMTQPHRVGLTARDFTMLADAGTFDSYARSELIEGEIWVVNSIHSWHGKVSAELCFRLLLALREAGNPLRAFSPVSIGLSDDNVPEPDIVVGDDHEQGFLPADKLRLVIEVSDTTADYDLGRKALLYARHGVPEYWVVDREGQRIVQHHDPSDQGYRQKVDVPFGQDIAALNIPVIRIATGGLD